MIVLVRLLSWLLSLPPYPAALAMGRGVGRTAGALARKRRRIAKEALQRSFPDKTDEDMERILREMFEHFGQVAVECLRSFAKGEYELLDQVTLRGFDHLPRDGDGFEPFLLLTGHVGNWELIGLVASENGVRVNAVVRSFKSSRFEEFWNRGREQVFGLGLLPTQNSFRACLRALKRRESVVILLDQHALAREGVVVEFFGRPASTHVGLALLSAHTQLPVIPAFMERTEGGRQTVHIHAPLAPPPDNQPESIQVATQTYARVIEEHIRAHPAQWIWPHRRWKVPETESEEG